MFNKIRKPLSLSGFSDPTPTVDNLGTKLAIVCAQKFRGLEMMRVRRILISLTLLLFVATNYGCVAIFAAGAITGAGQYVKYNLDSIANRTYMGNLQHVTEVAVHALKSMQIAIDNIQREEAGARIFAAANNVNIKISLNTISVNTTKVSIDVSKYAVLKDKATARAIITQIDTVMVQGDKRLAKHML